MDEMLGATLQENLLTLLSFDKDRFKVIRNAVDVGLYTGMYREVASRVYVYIDKYKTPPEDHLPDILLDKLESDNRREAALYEDIIDALHNTKDGVNAEFIMNRLETFVKRQSLRSMSVDLVKALQKDTEDSLKDADDIIRKATKQSLKVFNPGLRLSDKSRVLDFLEFSDWSFPTGILELDKRNFGPTRKELQLYIARYKSGKTWWLIQLAKMSALGRIKVVHITLEMSEARCAQRYFQGLFSIAKRKGPYPHMKFTKDDTGHILTFDKRLVKPRMTFDDPNIRKKLSKKIDEFGARVLDNIYIKQFPTGRLTIRDLEAYLDNLETVEGFVPDFIIIDYPDLMKLSADNPRGSLDEIYKDIRGLLVERNMAGAVVSQSNRGGAEAKVTKGKNIAEAYLKNAHADCILTFSQTPAEKKLGLARITVDGGRNDEDGITIVISQNYNIGQYVVDSALMIDDYWEEVESGPDSERRSEEVPESED
jgi:hypothetical protein